MADHDFTMAFYAALPAAFQRYRIARAGWNGKGMWVAAQVPDAHSKMSSSYLYLKTVDDKLVPWLPSQSDIFARDWAVVGDAD